MKRREIIRLREITKSFPGVKALDKVDLSVFEGEVHVLLGENGAGKSTMMNIICGNYQPDGGDIYWNGELTQFQTPRIAQEAGVGIVHQENSLLPHLDIKSNIFLGHYPKTVLFLNQRSIEKQSRELLRKLGLENMDANDYVERLSLADKQMVEIAKAISISPKLLLLDEPTAALTKTEIDILFNIIRKLKSEGVGIIYISHRLEEVFQIADRVTILRDGVRVLTKPVEEMNIDSVILNMVGRNLDKQKKELDSTQDQSYDKEVLLQVEKLSAKGRFHDINLKLHRGEVLGIAGLVGAGRSELLESIFGYTGYDDGEIFIKGKKERIKHPKDAIRNKMALIPEERKVKGLFLNASVKDNINLVTIGRNKKRLLLDDKKQRDTANQYVERLQIKTPSIDKRIQDLSGGNQQKAILARWLLSNPEILLLDEPTHGIDVGAKGEIYQIIRDLKKAGIGIILVSSEMPELILMSDRIAVMNNGELSGKLRKEEITEENIMMLAAGVSL